MDGFHWPALMRAGLRGLGLRPDQFWALTPGELTIMLGSENVEVPLTRDRLAELSSAYPDVIERSDDE